MCIRDRAYEEPTVETSPSVTVSAMTKGKPPVVTGLKAKSGLVKKVELQWDPPKSLDVVGYILYRSTTKTGKFDQIKKIRDRETTSYTDDTEGMGRLRDGVTYYYIISTFNKVEVESEYSSVVMATTKARPSKPVGLQGEKNLARRIPLTWKANAEKDIVAYRIYRSDEQSGEKFSELARVSGKTSYTDEKLLDGHTYRYRIQAEDADELLSDFSDMVTITTKPRPSSPREVMGVVRQDGKVEIKWKAGGEQDITGYNVYEKGFFRPEPVARGVKGTAYIDERPLKKGKERVYLVTAVDADGLESDFGMEITVVGR
ncbi:MAG: hypothetical protein N2Z74_09620, partial [Syntrophales bacterium]|nr:hypothetical protein [Syntrophales bacterium]